MKCIAHFSVNAPLRICEQFIDKKKAMVTYGNLFYQILLCISIFKAEFTHSWARQKEKKKTCAEHKRRPAFSFRSFLETLFC